MLHCALFPFPDRTHELCNQPNAHVNRKCIRYLKQLQRDDYGEWKRIRTATNDKTVQKKYYGMGTTTCSIECTGSCGHPLVPTTDGAAPALRGQLSAGGVAADALCVEGVERSAPICGGSDGVAVRDSDW